MSSPEEVKSCCAAAYGSDAVALLLGESYHPGGAGLTRRLAAALELRTGQRVLDVASGPGTTARLLASEFGVDVDGVDLSVPAVTRATADTVDAGLADRVRFRVGDAEHMPHPGGRFDAVVCECALCTFPDKHAAAAEFARVLRPGGRVAITDVTVAAGQLPAELGALTGRVACIADARPVGDYRRILTDAGLRVLLTESHDREAARMIEQIQARVTLLTMTAPGRLREVGIDVDAVARFARVAAQAVTDGQIGYTLIVAEKPH